MLLNRPLTLRVMGHWPFVKKLVGQQQDKWATTHRCSWGNHLESSRVRDGFLALQLEASGPESSAHRAAAGTNGQKVTAFWASLSLGISSSRQSGAGSTQDGGLRMLLSVPGHRLLSTHPDYRLVSIWPQTPSQASLHSSLPKFLTSFFLSVPKAAGLGLVVWNKRIQLNILFYIKTQHLPWGPDKSSACPSSSGSYSGKKGSVEALGPVSEGQTKWWSAVLSAGIHAHVTDLGFSGSLWGPGELLAFLIVVCLIWSSFPHLLTPDSDPFPLTLTLSLSQDVQSIFLSSGSSVNSMGMMQRDCVPETTPAYG